MSEIDLRDFPFIPLYIHRLQKSKAWLLCKRDPALAFYMVNLWVRAWHEVPCGSLEDDDDVLADAAMCDPKTWARVKDRVLRGWRRDGDRLYHCVVAEIAQTSWDSKQKQRQRTEAARHAKLQGRDKPATRSVTPSVTENVTGDVTDSKGQGLLEEKKSTPPPPPGEDGVRRRRTKPEEDPEFEAFWLAYPRRVAKGHARSAFKKALGKTSAAIIMSTLRAHRFTTDPDRVPYPASWLNGERWADEQTAMPLQCEAKPTQPRVHGAFP